jgi:hypothetical protein
MVPFDEVCHLFTDPARAGGLLGDAVRQVSKTAEISVPAPVECSSATSARLSVEWRDGRSVNHAVHVGVTAVQGGSDPITEITVTLPDVLEPADRVVVARGLHRILDLFTAEVEHPAAPIDLTDLTDLTERTRSDRPAARTP